MNEGTELKMAPRSDHSQSPVRSAQGEVVSNREFQLCNLRRITSAREPLAVEQDHRKISPMRRKLRKNHHIFNSERMGLTVPRQLMRNFVSAEEKLPTPQQSDRASSSTQPKVPGLEPDMYDLGPTEILYSSPFEMSSSVYSSQCTTVPSCSSVPSSLASSALTRFTSSTLKCSPESTEETSTGGRGGPTPARRDASPDPSTPSVALQKCVAEGFENLEDIMKLSPREQVLLPRSVYLAAQLAATPNINYSAKYGFRPLHATRWESPRSISANFASNADPALARDLPSYFREASHPLKDLKFIAKPWWVSLFKGGERKVKRKLHQRTTIKKGLFTDSVDYIFDSTSNCVTPNEDGAETMDMMNDVHVTSEQVRTPSKDQIYSLLLQKINEKRTMILKTMKGRSVVEVNSRATQTYITHPSYAHNHVEFWNEHSDNNEPTVILKEATAKHEAKNTVNVATSCSLHSVPFGFQCVSYPDNGLLQTNPTPFAVQNFATPGPKLPGFQYFNPPPPGFNYGPPFPYVPMSPLKFVPNQNLRWNAAAPIRMPMMNGTGDTGNKMLSSDEGCPKVFIPVTYLGDPMPKMVPSLCEIRPFTNNQVVFINQPGISHTPCLVQPMGVPLS